MEINNMATGYQLHKVYLGTALLLSQISHCVHHKCGAVLVKEGRIIAQGINGTPQGLGAKMFEILNKKKKMSRRKINKLYNKDKEKLSNFFQKNNIGDGTEDLDDENVRNELINIDGFSNVSVDKTSKNKVSAVGAEKVSK